ncbi:hypothetical protein PM082_024355 [Marasmius tenuissimus]|nr:hypothetical protein PM082_024355 [Marasmius tenuissimus]
MLFIIAYDFVLPQDTQCILVPGSTGGVQLCNHSTVMGPIVNAFSFYKLVSRPRTWVGSSLQTVVTVKCSPKVMRAPRIFP